MVERFSITPFGLEVVVVVVVSDDGEGVGVKTGAGGGTVPYSVVVVVSLVAVGPHAVQKPTPNAAIDMVTHDFQYCILLILHTINGGTQFELVPAFIVPELWLPTCVLRTDQ